MKKNIFAAICAIMLSGCVSQNYPDVIAVKTWENHYMTTESFKQGTKYI